MDETSDALVIEASHFDLSPPVSSLIPHHLDHDEAEPDRDIRHEAAFVGGEDPVVQREAAVAPAPAVIQNFEGIG